MPNLYRLALFNHQSPNKVPLGFFFILSTSVAVCFFFQRLNYLSLKTNLDLSKVFIKSSILSLVHLEVSISVHSLCPSICSAHPSVDHAVSQPVDQAVLSVHLVRSPLPGHLSDQPSFICPSLTYLVDSLSTLCLSDCLTTHQYLNASVRCLNDLFIGR